MANDGSVLVHRVRDLMSEWALIPVDGEPVRLGSLAPPAKAAFLLPDASAVVYQVYVQENGPGDDPPGELRLRYLDGTDVSLGVSGVLADVSRDGGVILFTATEIEGDRQAFSLQLPSGAPRQITHLQGGIEPVAFAGDRSAILAVSQSRILRIGVDDGRVETLLGPLPIFDRGLPDTFESRKLYIPIQVPGSTYRIAGAQLTETTTVAPLPAETELDGIRVVVNGTPAAILWASPLEIGYQVDWATPTSPETTVAVRHEASGWEGPLATKAVLDQFPQGALSDADGFTLAVHQNFDRLVTAADPALRGEYVHLYATGLGPVDPPVGTGEPSPSGPLAVITTPCVWTGYDERGERPAEVAFAGLAPGLVGFYQVVVRIPDDAQGESFGLRCDSYGGFGRIPVRP
jgi:uncharacterized protein (TIGR03437 family)